MKHWSKAPMIFASIGLAGCATSRAPQQPPPRGQPQGCQDLSGKPQLSLLTYRLMSDEHWYGDPKQQMPANGTLAKGTRCSIIKTVGSYTEIWAEEGTCGYVSTGSLAAIQR